jgi:hypothetical protein
MAFTKAQTVLNELKLPAYLVEMIQEGTLFDEIDKAYEKYERSVALLDAWEAANPKAAPLAPWFKAREAWKTLGCPRPEWYEVLHQQQDFWLPIKKTHIEQNLLQHSHTIRYRRLRNKLKLKRQHDLSA